MQELVSKFAGANDHPGVFCARSCVRQLFVCSCLVLRLVAAGCSFDRPCLYAGHAGVSTSVLSLCTRGTVHCQLAPTCLSSVQQALAEGYAGLV